MVRKPEWTIYLEFHGYYCCWQDASFLENSWFKEIFLEISWFSKRIGKYICDVIWKNLPLVRLCLYDTYIQSYMLSKSIKNKEKHNNFEIILFISAKLPIMVGFPRSHHIFPENFQAFQEILTIFTCIPVLRYSTSSDVSIEGFHDAVRTPYALRPGRHVGFFWNNKICLNFVSILFEMI